MPLSKEVLKTIPSIKTNCSREIKTIKWKKKGILSFLEITLS
jgi:hypothetical protein